MDKELSVRLGFWSAGITAVLGGIYLILLIVFFASEGFAFPPTPLVQLIGGLITFFTAPALLVMFVAIHQTAPAEKKILGLLGVCFTTLFVISVSINRFVQLTVIQQSPPGPASQDLARFLPYSTGSVMFALEILGWGFFLSLACLAVAPLFRGGKLETSARWLYILFGTFSLLSVAGFASETPLTAAGFVAWGPILLALTVVQARLFSRATRRG